MTKKRDPSKNKPVTVVWQRGCLRIVAVDDVDAEGESVQWLTLERCNRDALGAEAWRDVQFYSEGNDEIGDAAYYLMTEIASRIDVVPRWVHDFVAEDCLDLDTGESRLDVDFEDDENDGGVA